MKLLNVITGLSDGGAEAVLYRLISHDPDDIHHVISLTGDGKYGPLLRQAGVGVTTLDMPRGKVTWRGLRRLWKVLRTQRPDVVQTWMYHADLLGGVVGRLARVPVVWGLRNTTLERGVSARSTIAVARLCGLLSRVLPQRIIACADAAVGVHAKMGYDAHRMVVIPNGYDLTRFAPDAVTRQCLRLAWSVPNDVPIIGMVARFDPQKDHTNLIAALERVREGGWCFQAVLVGSGVAPENRNLAERIAAAGLEGRVKLLGPTQDVPAVMNALDVHVLSSAYGEAFPNVLAEAMACGTPCVTTDVGDAARIVGDTGWVVPPRNPRALADAIQQALRAWQDRSHWAERQAACRLRIAEAFSIDAMVRRYREVWQAMLPGRHDEHN
jgi:glycosyltransferase involved in cell wall biosynthesis